MGSGAPQGPTTLRLAVSKVDQDGITHPNLGASGAGAQLTVEANAQSWTVTIGPGDPVDMGTWVEAWGETASTFGFPEIVGTDVLLHLPSSTSGWVSGAAILAFVRVTAPTATDTDWANACAAAVNAGIENVLGTAAEGLPEAAIAEIATNALTAGGDAYRRRDQPFGLTSYQDLQGLAQRVARDYLEAIRPQLNRWRAVADGIA
jgi:hypothetical protein